MRRFLIVLTLLVTLPFMGRAVVWYSTEYDYKTAAMMEQMYLDEYAAEQLDLSSIEHFLKHYKSAEIATVGIFASKFLDRKAMKDAGILGTQENYYYRHIRFLVEKRIIPRLLYIGSKLIYQHPEKALYWGPAIMKTCTEVQNLCKQFELVVTNGKLSFSDINFLEICPQLKTYFDLAKLGGSVDWKQLFNDLSDFPRNYTKEDLLADFKNVFTGVTMAGSDIIENNAYSVFDGLAEKPQKVQDILTGFSDAYNSIMDGTAVKSFLGGVVGDFKDSLAVTKLFTTSAYNLQDFISQYLNNFGGTFYTQRWYIYHTRYGYSNVVYEEVFDSKTMDLNSFSSQMEIRRKDYERNDALNEGSPWTVVRYYIGKDTKMEYTVENEQTVRGASTASIHLKCDKSLELAKGSFSFKVNDSYSSSKLHDYALPPGSITQPSKPDDSDITDKIAELQGKIRAVESDMSATQYQINELTAQRDTCSNAEQRRSLNSQILMLQYDLADLRRDSLALVDQMAPYQEAANDLDNDYANELDGPYRINTAMAEVTYMVGIVWDDAGHWEGDIYVRTGHVTSGGETVVFRADVKKTRSEKHFLGIRIHRAIVQVDWKVTSDLSSASVVDVLTFSDSDSDADIARQVNQRMDEIRAENPGCQVTVSYGYKNPPEQDSPDEAYHLLWVADRVAIAREIDERLVTIDSRLALLEKWLYEQSLSGQSLWEIFDRGFVRRRFNATPIDHAYDRWIGVAMSGGVNIP